MQRRTLVRAATGAVVLGAAGITPVQAQSLPKFRFNLGWRVEASAAGFILAQQRGYYKDAGVDVQIDTCAAVARRCIPSRSFGPPTT